MNRQKLIYFLNECLIVCLTETLLSHLILCNFVILLQAANPGCVLEDFVRWYSPRDWVEEKIINSDGSVASKGSMPPPPTPLKLKCLVSKNLSILLNVDS